MKLTRRYLVRVVAASITQLGHPVLPVTNTVQVCNQLPQQIPFRNFECLRYYCSEPSAKVEDRKFHCSVCKKSFRLEMAAALHIKQAHAGNATVESGEGPGFVATSAPVQRGSPMQTSTSRPTHSRPRRETDDGEEPNFEGMRRKKKKRPLPKPLFTPDDAVPEEVTVALMEMWDAIGGTRMGPEFVASTSIMRVGATGQSHDAPEEEVNQMPDSTKVWLPKPQQIVEMEDSPFAMATLESHGPFVASATENPFLHAGAMKAAREARKKGQVLPPSSGSAMGSPFAQAATPSQTPQSPFGVSPFAQVAQSQSPFAQAASPFAQTNQAASPFAQAATPFAQTASPFAQAASPFVTPGQTASPFMQNASPFTSNATMPVFDQSQLHLMNGMSLAGMPEGFMGQGFMQDPAAITPQKTFTCNSCGRAFKSAVSMAAHAKAKHNIELPALSRKAAQRKQAIPDLPAYVPSPVDLSATSPFGVENDQSASDWNNIEMFPHAHTFSNTNIISEVKKVEVLEKHIALVLELLSDDGIAEEIPVKIHEPIAASIKDQLKEGVTVSVVGQLRLNPQHDEKVNKYFYFPVIEVVSPMGSVHCLT